MGTEYQIFNGKKYVSLRRFWNMEGKYNTEKAKKEELEEENRTLKGNVEFLHSCLDDRDKSIAIMQEENKKMEDELEEIKNDLEHRDSFFSIMRDVLANETITNDEIAMITYCVVHEECGDYDLSKPELKIAKEFWGRKYV